MASSRKRPAQLLHRVLRGKVRFRFTRFMVAAIAAFATSEITLTICAGPLHLHSTPAAILSWFTGALVSYILSRWAWERKGRPNLLKETLPFWVVSALVIVVLTLATKFGYHAASWLGLEGAKRVLFVDAVYAVANVCTFLLRFVFFHYVLFAGSGGSAATSTSDSDSSEEPFAMVPDRDEERER
jgi:putative flippase GtrA